MTKAQKNKKILKLIKEYQVKFNLQGWDIRHKLVEETHQDKVAIINADFIYTDATITVFRGAFEKTENIREIIRHELLHCLTDPLYMCASDLLQDKLVTYKDLGDKREWLTESLCKIIGSLEK